MKDEELQEIKTRRHKDPTSMEWISVEERLPQTKQRVLVCFTNDYGKTRVTCADYIAPKTVLSEDYIDDDHWEMSEYDEEKDCYWTPAGYYESNYYSEINYQITDQVTHWMPLPQAIESTASPSPKGVGVTARKALNPDTASASG